VTEERARVRFQLESHPENVALVRSALSSLGEALALSEELVSDLKTAISEACNNVALHAYGTSSGPMIVEIDATDVGVSVRVVDHGTGITRISGGEDRMGLGLAVIRPARW
jgi:serine/threonine-protein kinase RsbW